MGDNPFVLPDGWKWARLSDINTAVNKSVIPRDYSDETFEYYSIPAFQEFGAPVLTRGSEILSNKNLVETGTVMFGKLNPRVLKVWLVQSDSSHRKIASTEFLLIRPDGDAVAEYLYYLCHSSNVVGQANQLVSGSTPSRERVDKNSFFAIPIPLPPLVEQHAIARTLRTVQQAKDARQHELKLERERKAALMEYLFTYGTRRETRKHTEIGMMPESWRVVLLGDYSEKPDYGYTASATSDDIGPKFLRITDIQEDGVNWATVPYSKCDLDTRKRYLLKPGDLVIARIGATTGKAFLIRDCPETVFASYLIRIRTQPDLLSGFLGYFCETRDYWVQINANKGGRLKGGVNIPILQRLILPMPPVDEQRDIVVVLNAIDSKIIGLLHEIGILDELFRATLDELMTGRLLTTSIYEA